MLRPDAALLVFEDADIEKAVEWACFGVFWTCGQVSWRCWCWSMRPFWQLRFLLLPACSLPSAPMILPLHNVGLRLLISASSGGQGLEALAPPPVCPRCPLHPAQICSSTSRLLVHKGIADSFFRQLKKRAESIKVGAGRAEPAGGCSVCFLCAAVHMPGGAAPLPMPLRSCAASAGWQSPGARLPAGSCGVRGAVPQGGWPRRGFVCCRPAGVGLHDCLSPKHRGIGHARRFGFHQSGPPMSHPPPALR